MIDNGEGVALPDVRRYHRLAQRWAPKSALQRRGLRVRARYSRECE